MSIGDTYLKSVIKRLDYYKGRCDKTFEQLNEDDFYFKPDAENNSIAIIIQHMAGNMLSRWTDFLTADGEKEWRNRDTEFEEQQLTKQQLIDFWNKGWACCLIMLRSLTEDDLLKTIHIRNEAQVVIDAINRQLAHYPYHTGQIIYIVRIIKKEKWKTLSIAKGQSVQYNQQLQSKS